MTPEKRVKVKVCHKLKEMGAYYLYPSTGGYGDSGVPDIIACLSGKFIAIECKANGNKPTKLQIKNLLDINKSKGVAIVVDENNVDMLEFLITSKQEIRYEE